MLDEFFYREKGLFLQKLHPLAAIIYICVLMALSLVFTNPLYLVGLFFCIGLAIGALDGLSSWELYLRSGLLMTVPIMIINPLVSKAGDTILWQGPHIPVYGKLTISLEAIFYSALMSVRLLDLVSVFCLYNIMVHPDKVLNILARFTFKSAMVLSIATRIFPAMVRQLENIREVQVMRGVDFNQGTLRQRLEKYTNLIYILLLSSLEDSMEIAEAMQARAFGSGPRTCYTRDTLRPRDLICLLASITALLAGIYGEIKGFGSFEFYPHLGPLITPGAIFILVILFGSLSIPAFLSWGWQHCPFFKSRI